MNVDTSARISERYLDYLLRAELVDYGPVKGTIVFRPYGYALWERVQDIFNPMMRQAGVKNAYFPLFIPYSLLEKEKTHVKGFSPELAVVTHGGGERLTEPLVVRPTSETIMYASYSKWLQSWRDLPILINQWNNIVRWEKRTLPFLRTSEFLWQEGHTAHATEEEAIEMQKTALAWYKEIYEKYFGVAVVAGKKSESEKFAGAKTSYTLEVLMPDGKALQGGTSHNLGQNFAKVFDVAFQDPSGKTQYAWQTSWGLSTRALGALVMTHMDDRGLSLPPQMAPIQIIIVPITGRGSDAQVLKTAEKLRNLLSDYRVEIDARDTYTPGWKFNNWELRGVPIRIEVGPKDVAQKSVVLVRRDTGEKRVVPTSSLVEVVRDTTGEMQNLAYERSRKFTEKNTHDISSYEEFKHLMRTKRGFLRAHWCESPACEAKIKDETKATTRCLPLGEAEEKGECVYCQKQALHRWYFAQAY